MTGGIKEECHQRRDSMETRHFGSLTQMSISLRPTSESDGLCECLFSDLQGSIVKPSIKLSPEDKPNVKLSPEDKHNVKLSPAVTPSVKLSPAVRPSA